MAGGDRLLPHADCLPARLSRGMRQRLDIARSLVHDPPLLLLDEPFTHLDAAGRQWLLGLLLELRARGHTLCFVTHEQEQLPLLATRVLELRGGKVFDVGTWLQTSRHSGPVVILSAAKQSRSDGDPGKVLRWAQNDVPPPEHHPLIRAA